MTIRTPLIWAQDHTKILITVKVQDLVDEQIEIQPNFLKIQGKTTNPNQEYSLDLELFNEIDPNDKETKYFKLGGYIKINLRKRDSTIWWPRLAKTQQKLHYVQVDWARWVDSDDESECDDGSFEMPNLTDQDLTDPGDYNEEEED